MATESEVRYYTMAGKQLRGNKGELANGKIPLSKATPGQQTLEDMKKRVAFRLDEELARKVEDVEEKLKKLGKTVDKIKGEVGKVGEDLNKIGKDILIIKKEKASADLEAAESVSKLDEMVKRLGELEGYVRMKLGGSEDGGSAVGSWASRSLAGSTWSVNTGMSVLSERDCLRVKKFVSDQDRRERVNNIVIKGASGVDAGVGDLKVWVENFISEKLAVSVVVTGARMSGNVVVARLNEAGEKAEIMKNKSKLRGSDVYIENDLSFEDRKIQEEIVRWVKKLKAEGADVKVGQGSVKVNGIWKKWRDFDATGFENDGRKGKGEEASTTAQNFS